MKHFNLLAIGILSLLLVGCSYNANEATSVYHRKWHLMI